MQPGRSTPMIRVMQAALLAAASLAAGCGSHPDDKAAVYAALGKNNLSSVMVKQDRRSGVITLSGIVTSADRKTQAETLARQAAPEYTIADNIQVRPIG